MVTRQATVKNAFGIHCRPSAVIASQARSYSGSIRASNHHGDADAKSVLELVGLAAACRQELTIAVEGPDEEQVCAQFVALFESQFDFER